MEKELYPVFRVDICFEAYAMEDKLIGAKSREDLIENFDFKSCLHDRFDSEDLQEHLFLLKNNKEYRIAQIKGLYTDKPYEVLDTFAYYE